MKYMVILGLIAIALLFAGGCSQIFPPVQSPATPAPTPAPAQTSAATAPAVTTTTPAVIIFTDAPTTAVTYSPTAALVSANTVIIQNMAFSPQAIAVSAGSMVRWVNKDKVTHSVLFPASTHISMFALSPGQAFSQRFSTPGVYNYTCSIYSSMQGSVIVTP